MAEATSVIGAIPRRAWRSVEAAASAAGTKGDHLDALAAEFEPDSQQRAERIVAACARMEGVEEELGLAVQSRRDRGVAWRCPFAGGPQQRVALFLIRPQNVVGDSDANPVMRGREI